MAAGTGVNLATAYVDLVVGTSNLARTVKTDLAGVDRQVSDTGQKAGTKFTDGFKRKLKVGALIGGAMIAAGGAKFLSGAISEASDLNESLNAIDVTFGKNAGGIKALGEEAAAAVGLSNTEFNTLSVQFGSFATTIAGKGGDVVGTMEDLTGRGADFASVMNLDVNEAMGLFQSGLAGEAEPLRKYGIDLSAAAVENHALAEGIYDGKGAMTESQKVQARYSLLMAATSKTQGDFANTSDGLANSQRVLGANWDNIKAKVGSFLLPVLEKLSGWVVNTGLPALERLGGFLKDRLSPVFANIRDVVVGLWEGFRDGEGVAGRVRDALGWVRDGVSAITQLFRKEGTGALAKWLNVPQDHAVIGFLQNVRDFVTVTLPAGFNRLKDVIQGAFSVLSGGTTGRLAAALEIPQGHAVIKFLQDFRLKVIAAFGWVRDVAIPTVIQFGSRLGSNRELLIAVGAGLLTVFAAFKTFMFIKAVTVAVRAFSAALAANPIGLVVVAIGLLVGALVYLYRNNETARRIMDAAWAGIKKAISAVVGWFRDTAWPLMKSVFGWIGGAATDMWRVKIKPALDGIMSVSKTVFGWVKNTGWPWLRDAFKWIGEKATWLWTQHISPALTKVKDKASEVFGWVKNTGWPWMRDALKKVGEKASWLYNDHIKPAFNNIRDKIAWAWDKAEDIFASFKSGLTSLGDKFRTVKDGIAEAWGAVVAAVGKPIVATIKWVNDNFLAKIESTLNKIPGVSGIELGRITVPTIPTAPRQGDTGALGRPGGLATGGPVPGWSPNDRADNIPAMLTAGEYVLPVRAVRALSARFGGGFLESLRRGLPGFAQGGRVHDDERLTPSASTKIASDGWFNLPDPIKWLKDRIAGLLSGIGSSWPSQGALGVLESAGSQMVDWARGKLFGSDGGGRMPAGGMSSAQIRAIAYGLDSTARMTSGYRPGAMTASGVPSYHGANRAADFVSGNMAGLARKLAASGMPWSELYYSPWGFMRRGQMVPSSNVASITRQMHYDHVHAAMASGGLVKPRIYDQGGILPPGGVGVNMSSRPELVLTEAQMGRMGGRAALVGEVHLHGVDRDNSSDLLDQLVMTVHTMRNGSLAERGMTGG